MPIPQYKNQLDKFIGKDVWVRVHETIKYGIGKYSNEHIVESWIRIIDSTKDKYIVNIINNKRISTSGFYSCSEDEKAKILSTSFGFPKTYFKLVEPLDCLTTDEILGGG